MALLHGEALAIFSAQRQNLPPLGFSHPLFRRIARQWRAWPDQPPGRRSGYDAQNPILMECFTALSSAEAESWR